MTTTDEYFDVIIIGAGLSGIGAAYHLQNQTHRTYAILEGRDSLGGTWDLFQYPGIRSDSDMYTLGYSFYPWLGEKAIADGPSILSYVKDTAKKNDIEKNIRFGHMVVDSNWSSADNTWTVTCTRKGSETVSLKCNFLHVCSGYYSYKGGYTPDFPGIEKFKGKVVHPQKWPEDLDYTNKRVVVIGSGATAVTIVPEMARTAQHVTMLQRSPTYIVSLPAIDPIAAVTQRYLPPALSFFINRWKNILVQYLNYWGARLLPGVFKKGIIAKARQALRPSKDYCDVDKHFSPRYNPWDQRLCVVPDADLFKSINEQRASVVTEHIETFTETGIKLQKSQDVLEADIVVSATGLVLEAMGGSTLRVDGTPVKLPDTFIYKGVMLSEIPNLAMTIGYTNASWTLKCDLACTYVCRVLNHMQKHGYKQCCPRRNRDPANDPALHPLPLLDFNSGYVVRSIANFPKQGPDFPWKLNQNYFRDMWGCLYSPVVEKFMEFK